MIVYIPTDLYAKLIAQIPLRYLRSDDYAPPGRPLRFNDLGRPLNYREKYKIKKWRAEGITEMVIKARIIQDAEKETRNREL